jgi:hypothetical protein
MDSEEHDAKSALFQRSFSNHPFPEDLRSEDESIHQCRQWNPREDIQTASGWETQRQWIDSLSLSCHKKPENLESSSAAVHSQF